MLAAATACSSGVSLLLWIVAVIIGIWGVVSVFRGAVLVGVALIIIAFLVGPGGVSIFC